MKNRGPSFLYKNSLSLVFLLLFMGSLGGQAYTGWAEHNEFLGEHRQLPTGFWEYLQSGHFLQATFENWESEFFQMALFVILTVFLRQIGSSESKEVEAEVVDKSQLAPKADSPWPVKKGGVWLAIYKHSLSIALMLLFVFSFAVHAYGSWLDHREQELLEGRPAEAFGDYLSSSRLWFESFQNWQSEFLSVFAIIFLSIYLRQVGSPQSKPVNAPHMETDTES
jgi:hypothetical protein